jgi:predicted site-specific integrase-resolvase
MSPLKPRALRRHMVHEIYGVSMSTIDRHVKNGQIRTRRVGKALLLKADVCEKAFGWPEDAKVEPTARDMAEMRELVG